VEKCGNFWRQGKGASACPIVPRETARPPKPRETFVMHACSACAGDYEDPDRTVRTPVENDDEEQCDVLNAETEEFPAAE
jgi:hypothetical protein